MLKLHCAKYLLSQKNREKNESKMILKLKRYYDHLWVGILFFRIEILKSFSLLCFFLNDILFYITLNFCNKSKKKIMSYL